MLFAALVALAVMSASAGPAAAAPPAAETPAASNTDAPPAPARVASATKTDDAIDDAYVCKTEVKTGSRFPHKICVRKDEVAEERYRDRKNLESIQSMRWAH